MAKGSKPEVVDGKVDGGQRYLEQLKAKIEELEDWLEFFDGECEKYLFNRKNSKKVISRIEGYKAQAKKSKGKLGIPFFWEPSAIVLLTWLKASPEVIERSIEEAASVEDNPKYISINDQEMYKGFPEYEKIVEVKEYKDAVKRLLANVKPYFEREYGIEIVFSKNDKKFRIFTLIPKKVLGKSHLIRPSLDYEINNTEADMHIIQYMLSESFERISPEDIWYFGEFGTQDEMLEFLHHRQWGLDVVRYLNDIVAGPGKNRARIFDALQSLGGVFEAINSVVVEKEPTKDLLAHFFAYIDDYEKRLLKGMEEDNERITDGMKTKEELEGYLKDLRTVYRNAKASVQKRDSEEMIEMLPTYMDVGSELEALKAADGDPKKIAAIHKRLTAKRVKLEEQQAHEMEVVKACEKLLKRMRRAELYTTQEHKLWLEAVVDVGDRGWALNRLDGLTGTIGHELELALDERKERRGQIGKLCRVIENKAKKEDARIKILDVWVAQLKGLRESLKGTFAGNLPKCREIENAIAGNFADYNDVKRALGIIGGKLKKKPDVKLLKELGIGGMVVEKMNGSEVEVDGRDVKRNRNELSALRDALYVFELLLDNRRILTERQLERAKTQFGRGNYGIVVSIVEKKKAKDLGKEDKAKELLELLKKAGLKVPFEAFVERMNILFADLAGSEDYKVGRAKAFELRNGGSVEVSTTHAGWGSLDWLEKKLKVGSAFKPSNSRIKIDTYFLDRYRYLCAAYELAVEMGIKDARV